MMDRGVLVYGICVILGLGLGTSKNTRRNTAPFGFIIHMFYNSKTRVSRSLDDQLKPFV